MVSPAINYSPLKTDIQEEYQHSLQYKESERKLTLNNNTNFPILHYFQQGTKKFLRLPLERLKKEPPYPFEEISLDIDFLIPYDHRSIVTPEGDIYLTGGRDATSRSNVLGKCYMLETRSKRLAPRMNMHFERFSHSICYMNKNIFVVGGIGTLNGGYLQSCERFDLVRR